MPVLPSRPLLAIGLLLALAACGNPASSQKAATEEDGRASSVIDRSTDTPPPVMPADAPPQEEVDPAHAPAPLSCRDEIGVRASAVLVERCRAVSPATHPPCNADNACGLIRDEIARACALYAPGEIPAQCAG